MGDLINLDDHRPEPSHEPEIASLSRFDCTAAGVIIVAGIFGIALGLNHLAKWAVSPLVDLDAWPWALLGVVIPVIVGLVARGVGDRWKEYLHPRPPDGFERRGEHCGECGGPVFTPVDGDESGGAA